jgi:Ca2+-binding EF-hand superfamily protein
LSRLVEFMMIDEDGDGTIAYDEAAKMFRNRYGE